MRQKDGESGQGALEYWEETRRKEEILERLKQRNLNAWTKERENQEQKLNDERASIMAFVAPTSNDDSRMKRFHLPPFKIFILPALIATNSSAMVESADHCHRQPRFFLPWDLWGIMGGRINWNKIYYSDRSPTRKVDKEMLREEMERLHKVSLELDSWAQRAKSGRLPSRNRGGAGAPRKIISARNWPRWRNSTSRLRPCRSGLTRGCCWWKPPRKPTTNNWPSFTAP